MSGDVVAELDAWLGEPAYVDTRERGREIERASTLIRAARDEIVALREQLGAVRGIAGNERKLSEAIIQQARDEALEEAARMCEGGYTTGSTASTLEAIAKAIRALKGKG